jgi:eukaryotic-like serine/threonine-protein kinase
MQKLRSSERHQDHVPRASRAPLQRLRHRCTLVIPGAFADLVVARATSGLARATPKHRQDPCHEPTSRRCGLAGKVVNLTWRARFDRPGERSTATLMSHRFVRCPHCKMPHDARERVCPNTGLLMPANARPIAKQGVRSAEVRSRMSEVPPSSRPPEPLAFDPQRDRVGSPNRARETDSSSQSLPLTRDLQRELIGRTVGDRYKIKGVLGEGGMGTVYDAEHLGLGRHVAIKVLSPTQAKKRVAVKRFQQEARAAGAIGHPNICEVYDLGLLDDGSPYLVMEKLVGQTLAERIAKEGGLPFDDVVEVVSQVLSGLVAAHEKGIVHRDIKPENIFLARRVGCPPIVKLLDFGVSKMMAEFQTGEDVLDLTRTGMVMGTPYYMSPEQARGERNLDGRVDVYACGVVMYEAIAGKRPFLAPNYNALLLAIINTTPRSVRDIRPATPRELEAIILRAMEKTRADRYASAKHMLRDLVPPSSSDERKRPVAMRGRTRSVPSVPELSPPAREGDTRIERGSRASIDRPGARPLIEPADRPDGPSATLRSRMAEPRREPEGATRIERMPKLAPSPFDSLPSRSESPLSPLPGSFFLESDDSIEIPIHVTAPEDEEIDVLLDEEDPTEIFRPGKYPAPRPAPNTRPSAAAPRSRAPASDWEGETVVKRPDMMPVRPPHSPPGHRPQVPFNPEETMKLPGSELDKLQNRQAPPPRRR